jgi:hypothetical protein
MAYDRTMMRGIIVVWMFWTSPRDPVPQERDREQHDDHGGDDPGKRLELYPGSGDHALGAFDAGGRPSGAVSACLPGAPTFGEQARTPNRGHVRPALLSRYTVAGRRVGLNSSL